MKPDFLTVVKRVPDHPDTYYDDLVDLNALTLAGREQLGKLQQAIANEWHQGGTKDFPFWLPEPDDIKNYREAILAEYMTPLDNPNLAGYHHDRGMRMGEDGYTIHISNTGNWSATHPEGGSLTSYEILGYHANTADLIRGWFDSGADIEDHRREMGYRTCGCGRSWKPAELETRLNWKGEKVEIGTCLYCARDLQPLL